MTYLNQDNITVALGASMADEPFVNVTTAQALTNALDAESADTVEIHSQSAHIWISSQPLELDFDFGDEYDLSALHFWNYWTEQYDVDEIRLTFSDSGGNTLDAFTFLPQMGVQDGSTEVAEDLSLNIARVQHVNAVISGSNGQVDFNNIGFTGDLSAEDPGGINRIIGDQFDNRLPGTAFDDLIRGKASNDVLLGRAGTDKLVGNLGRDRLDGGPGDDTLKGGRGKDVLIGGFGDDDLRGGPGRDTASYADTNGRVRVDLRTEGPQDTRSAGMDSLTGIERLIGTEFRDRLKGDDGANVLKGLGRKDTLVGRGGDDKLVGNKGGDVLKGGGGADKLKGGAGSDDLRGGAGRDVLNGSRGDDTLTGNNGRDRFVFNDRSGHDTVTDFGTGADRLVIRSDTLDSFADVIAIAADEPTGVRIVISAESSIRLTGVTTADLDAGDFIF